MKCLAVPVAAGEAVLDVGAAVGEAEEARHARVGTEVLRVAHPLARPLLAGLRLDVVELREGCEIFLVQLISDT